MKGSVEAVALAQSADMKNNVWKSKIIDGYILTWRDNAVGIAITGKDNKRGEDI